MFFLTVEIDKEVLVRSELFELFYMNLLKEKVKLNTITD